MHRRNWRMRFMSVYNPTHRIHNYNWWYESHVKLHVSFSLTCRIRLSTTFSSHPSQDVYCPIHSLCSLVFSKIFLYQSFLYHTYNQKWYVLKSFHVGILRPTDTPAIQPVTPDLTFHAWFRPYSWYHLVKHLVDEIFDLSPMKITYITLF